MKKLESEVHLQKLFEKHFHTITNFYEISKRFETSDSLCKIAITGSTYRTFVRKDPSLNQGMSIMFKLVASKLFNDNPSDENIRTTFLKEMSGMSRGKFKNWEMQGDGVAKILKVYNLYANYWVAFQLAGKMKNKISSIENLKVPLDKYSLTFIKDLYNETLTNENFKLRSNLSMGKVKSLKHYHSINDFINRLSHKISKVNGLNFQPVFIDIIQAEENGLNWYSGKINIFK